MKVMPNFAACEPVTYDAASRVLNWKLAFAPYDAGVVAPADAGRRFGPGRLARAHARLQVSLEILARAAGRASSSSRLVTGEFQLDCTRYMGRDSE